MARTKEQHDRIDEVRRIFEDNAFGSAELLEGWDGDDLGELAEFMTEEEFQTLLDQLDEAPESTPS